MYQFRMKVEPLPFDDHSSNGYESEFSFDRVPGQNYLTETDLDVRVNGKSEARPTAPKPAPLGVGMD